MNSASRPSNGRVIAVATRKEQMRGKRWSSLSESLNEKPVTKLDNGCWVRIDGHTYDRVSWQGKQILAHRAAYTVAYGPISDDVYVCHVCDNPPCINPDHLWLGRDADNVHDMFRKGRAERGKLNAETVRGIREEYQLGYGTQKVLALRYDVTQSTISKIVLEQTWKFV